MTPTHAAAPGAGNAEGRSKEIAHIDGIAPSLRAATKREGRREAAEDPRLTAVRAAADAQLAEARALHEWASEQPPDAVSVAFAAGVREGSAGDYEAGRTEGRREVLSQLRPVTLASGRRAYALLDHEGGDAA